MIKENSIWHGIGFGILLSIVISTLLGWIGLGDGLAVTFILHLICYIPAGFLVAYLNPKHPYTLAAIAGVILSALNQVFTVFYLAPGMLAAPFILNLGILFGIFTALIGAILAEQPWRRLLKGRV